MNYIFVYGLLKSMHDNEASQTIRKHCTLLGEGYTFGRMFNLGSYPGITHEANATTKVYGELYQIEQNEDELIAYLDAFEECGPEFEQPNEYRKELIPVKLGNKNYEAAAYIYNRNLTGLTLIASGKYEDIQGHR